MKIFLDERENQLHHLLQDKNKELEFPVVIEKMKHLNLDNHLQKKR